MPESSRCAMREAEDPVLEDLLRGMISGSHWCYAELWLPNTQARRHLVVASYLRPGAGSGLRALQSLSHALALAPGDCLLQRAHGAACMSDARAVDPCGDELAASPRAAYFREASVASSLSFYLVDGQRNQRPVGLVVLMSQRGLASDAEGRAADALHRERLDAICATATPYLRHLEQARNQPFGEGGRVTKEAEHEPNAALCDPAAVDEKQHARSPITYKSPMRRRFNAVGEDMRPKHNFKTSPSALKLGIHDGASLSVEYQIAITEALSNFPPHENGKPHAVRVSALWAIFEQLCEVPSAISGVLKLLRLELKEAIFSDDLMSADDGLSLIRMPFFEQIDYRAQQVIERDQNVARLQRQLDEMLRIQDSQREQLDKAGQVIAALERRAFLAERRLVKIKLETFYMRKNMAEDLRREQKYQLEMLEAEIATLKSKLKSEKDKTQHLVVEDYKYIDVLDIMRDSMSALACSRPPISTNLVCSSVPDNGIGFQRELGDLKGELEILRNANLTQFERAGFQADPNSESIAFKGRYSFVPTMEVLDQEIAALNSCMPGHGDVATLAATYADMLDKVNQELTHADKRDNTFGVAAASKAAANNNHDSMRRVPSTSTTGQDVEDDAEVEAESHTLEEDLNEGEEVSYWKLWREGSAMQPDVELFRMLDRRSVTKRERVRTLDMRTVTAWVYDVLQRKSFCDLLLRDDSSLACRSVEETLYDYLDEKYGTAQASNLVVRFDLATV